MNSVNDIRGSKYSMGAGVAGVAGVARTKDFLFAGLNNVRVIAEPTGDLWFVAKDVAEALGYQNTNDAVSTHCEDGVAKCYPIEDSMGRIQQVRVIDESDMYSP